MDRYTKILGIFSPKRAAERLRNQAALRMMDDQVRKYEGAGKGRRFKSFNHDKSSTNQQISTALTVLRDRSRDLAKNNPYGKSSIRKIGNNVVGTGILATPVTGSKPLDKKLKLLWSEWADDTLCDFDDLQNFYGIQKMVMKTVAKCGECVVRRIWVRRKKKYDHVPLELQVLEPDFIDHEKNSVTAFDNGEYIVNGVQFDKNGKRIAYWIFDRHPMEQFAESKPVPASDIIHVFEVEDPGQVRGVPFFSASILRMKDFDEFEDAELLKQKIASCFAVFIESPELGNGVGDENTKDDLSERIEPGIIQRGLPGDKFTFASPPAFNALREYSHQSLQGQAAGIGLSYEEYTGDLSNTNFSSGRMGWLAMHRNIEDWQWNMMVPMFCNKVWKWFVSAAVLSGNIPQGMKESSIKVTWTAPRREMIDPVKETQALVEMIRGGLLSWQDAVRQLGFTPEEIIEQMKKDKDMFDKAGLMPECDPRYDADKMMKNVKPAAVAAQNDPGNNS